jgi:hypothetical protein
MNPNHLAALGNAKCNGRSRSFQRIIRTNIQGVLDESFT